MIDILIQYQLAKAIVRTCLSFNAPEKYTVKQYWGVMQSWGQEAGGNRAQRRIPTLYAHSPILLGMLILR